VEWWTVGLRVNSLRIADGCGNAVSFPAFVWIESLNGNEIHRLENVITLEMSIHAEFNDLFIWFKPVAVCLRLPSCTCIDSCYRDLPVPIRSILKMVQDGCWLATSYRSCSPLVQQMSDYQNHRYTTSNSTHFVVR